ncbi:MAG: topology modulation protein [Thermoleophilia bacterium]|nr:topology modulation protein [Thermoleophilia bacterium]
MDQPAPQRIAIIGICGGGKSTLARRLGDVLHLPVIHLDQHHHLPGFLPPDPDVWRATYETLEAGESWVMDGNYTSVARSRFERADLVLHVRAPALVAAIRVVRRALRSRGIPRPESAPGCVEQPFTPQFRSFVWWVLCFNRRQRPKLERALAGVPPERIVRVSSWVEAEALVARLAALR